MKEIDYNDKRGGTAFGMISCNLYYFTGLL